MHVCAPVLRKRETKKKQKRNGTQDKWGWNGYDNSSCIVEQDAIQPPRKKVSKTKQHIARIADYSCPRDWCLSAIVCAQLKEHPLRPFGTSHSTIVLRGSRGFPIMPREASLSGNGVFPVFGSRKFHCSRRIQDTGNSVGTRADLGHWLHKYRAQKFNSNKTFRLVVRHSFVFADNNSEWLT